MSTEENFDDESFANNVKRFAAAMGKRTVEMAYTLFYALSDRETQTEAVIGGRGFGNEPPLVDSGALCKLSSVIHTEAN